MVKIAKVIDVSATAELARIAEEINRTGESIILNYNGCDLAIIEPLDPNDRRRLDWKPTEEEIAAFRAAAGGWADIDTDALLRDIYEARRRPMLPPDEP